MKKKRIVLNDKEKIASVIRELDEKKNEALRNAWKKVNKVRLFIYPVWTQHHFVPLPFPDSSSRALSVNTASTLVIWSDPVFIVSVGFWLHILHSSARHHSQAGSTWRANRAGRPGGESRLRQRVEGEPQWTQWRSKVMSFISLRANLANKCLIIKNKLNKWIQINNLPVNKTIHQMISLSPRI